MNPKSYKILFLCTGNSARSILGEYLIRVVAGDRFESYSAGARPTGRINPIVLQVLRDSFKMDASGARSKSWEEFKAFSFDFVITVCDNAKESCPVWPGQPIIAHWSSLDPAEFEGTDEEKLKATLQVALQIKRRIELLASLPLEKMERLKLQNAMRDIGSTQ